MGFALFKRLLAILLIGAFIAAGYLAFTAFTLPNVRKALAEGVKPTQTSQIIASDGQTVIMSQGKFYHKPLPLSEMSPVLVDCLVATEDRRFYQHGGIDPLGLARALFVNFTSRGLKEGGSTLTQQLAKNVFLSNERTFQRKIREGLLALKLEHQLTKEQILELYLNNVYFGEGAYGIGAASQIYFDRRPGALSIPQAALLAGLPQAPSRYNPFDNLDLAKKRRNEVLWNLVETGKLAKDDYDRYSQAPVYLNPNGRDLGSSDQAPFYNRLVINEAIKELGIEEQTFWQQGLKVYTTLDIDAQRVASQQLRRQLAAAGRTAKKNQAALVSINTDGKIVAYLGGKDFSVSQFDIASQAKRQAGSSFKVFVYTAAIAQGMTPKTVYNDAPFKLGNWEPKNYDKAHRGYMTLAKALSISNNVVAVKVANDVGIENVVSTAYQMGIQSQFDTTPSVALGSAGVNLLEMTTAYSVLCDDGYYVQPYAIERIVDRNGETIYQHMPRKHNVLNKVTRDTVVKMMRGVIQHGTGAGAALSRFPVAGKTGTTDDYRDAWFIGFTPDVTTGVWVGNEDNSSTGGVAGGGLPARIWRAFMGSYTSSLPRSRFDLSQALPFEEGDFFSYDINNLAASDKNSPAVEQRIEDAFSDPAQLEGVENQPSEETPIEGETPNNPDTPVDSNTPPQELPPSLPPNTPTPPSGGRIPETE